MISIYVFAVILHGHLLLVFMMVYCSLKFYEISRGFLSTRNNPTGSIESDSAPFAQSLFIYPLDFDRFPHISILSL